MGGPDVRLVPRHVYHRKRTQNTANAKRVASKTNWQSLYRSGYLKTRCCSQQHRKNASAQQGCRSRSRNLGLRDIRLTATRYSSIHLGSPKATDTTVHPRGSLHLEIWHLGETLRRDSRIEAEILHATLLSPYTTHPFKPAESKSPKITRTWEGAIEPLGAGGVG